MISGSVKKPGRISKEQLKESMRLEEERKQNRMFQSSLSEELNRLRLELEETKNKNKEDEEKKKSKEERQEATGSIEKKESKPKSKGGKVKGKEDSDLSADQTEFWEWNGEMYKWWKKAWFWQDKTDPSKWTKCTGTFQ